MYLDARKQEQLNLSELSVYNNNINFRKITNENDYQRSITNIHYFSCDAV